MSERDVKAVAWFVLVTLSAALAASGYTRCSAASDADAAWFFRQPTVSGDHWSRLDAARDEAVTQAGATSHLVLDGFQDEAADQACCGPVSHANAL